MDSKTIARRLKALRLVRANNVMEGLYESERDAVFLDAYACGEIDRAEFERRIRENPGALSARLSDHERHERVKAPNLAIYVSIPDGYVT